MVFIAVHRHAPGVRCPHCAAHCHFPEQNRIAEFHTELEVVPAQVLASTEVAQVGWVQ